MTGGNRRHRLHEIRQVAESMRAAPIEAPDLTSSILDRVDAARPFLAPSVRRRLPWVRIGLLGCAAAATLAVALTHRWAPKAVQLTAQPAPISEVVQCMQCVTAKEMLAVRPRPLTLGEADASSFFSAIAAVASLSENEGRSAFEGAVLAPATIAASVPACMPEVRPPLSSVASARLDAALFPPQSGMSDRPASTALIFADPPKVRAASPLLDHDLDGQLMPR